MAEAAQAMAMLQQLLQNLQMTEGGGGSGGPQMPGMKGLQETLRDQQGLSDEAFRDLQQGAPGEQPNENEGQGGDQEQGEEESLADRQEQLRNRLDGLNQGPLPGAGTERGSEGRDALDDAERRMQEAERALREGDISGALDRQAEAMDAMRDGMRALGEAQAESDRREAEGPEGERLAERETARDPLGREPGDNGRRIGSDRNLLQGQDVERRAQDLLDEIRRRAGEQNCSDSERDYLKRLLDLF